MAWMQCACELEPAVIAEMEIPFVPEFGADEEPPGLSVAEEAGVDGEPISGDGALGLIADVGRDRDEDGDDSDFAFDDFDSEPEDDDLDDDFDDDDDDLDDDLDDLDDDDEL